jgi:hypothetical protein
VTAAKGPALELSAAACLRVECCWPSSVEDHLTYTVV